MDFLGLFLWMICALIALYLLWYFFLTDSNFKLAVVEKFGRKVSHFRGQVIWVTGASTGLGEAMALELASVGAKLILSARSKDLLKEVKNKCLECSQGKLECQDILVLPFDMTDYDSHKCHVKEALDHFGQIDILINNAGRYQISTITKTDLEVERDIFAVNVLGGINLSKLVLNHFLEKKKGRLAVVSSMAGKCGVPSCASYVATKHAIHGYYEALRMEHRTNNIHVTVICPGIFMSSILEKAMNGKKGEILEKSVKPYKCSQMTSARCAHLSLVAIANNLYEAWVANQPFQFMMWAAQYAPDTNRHIMASCIYTKRRVRELVEGRWPDDLPTWQPLFR